MILATKHTQKIHETEKSRRLNSIDLDIKDSNKTKEETTVILENLGLELKIHEGLKYTYSKDIKSFIAMSQDSNEITYLIAEVPKNMNKPNMKELWITDVKEKDANLNYRDTLDYSILETRKDGKEYISLLKFKVINGNQMVLNSVSLKSNFSEFKPKMEKVFESIRIK